MDHGPYMRKWERETLQKVKKEIYLLLGSKCSECGYDGPALQIDHVNNDGYKDKSSRNLGFYQKILNKIKEGSKDYGLLCANHNWEKELKRRSLP